MSNLIDKEKLLKGLLGLLSSEPTMETVRLVDKFSSQVISGEFDFKPAESSKPSGQGCISIDQIRRVCIGAATGRACPQYRICGFVQLNTEVPCESVLKTLGKRILKSECVKIGDLSCVTS